MATVKYKVVGKVNPRDLTAPKKYYPIVKPHDKFTLWQLAHEVAENTNFAQSDVMSVLNHFVKLIPKVLSWGFLVDLGYFGTFQLVVHSTGSEDEETVTSDNIIRKKIHYRMGQMTKERVDAIHFDKYVPEAA